MSATARTPRGPIVAAWISILVALGLQFLGLDLFFAGFFFGSFSGMLIVIWMSETARNPGS